MQGNKDFLIQRRDSMATIRKFSAMAGAAVGILSMTGCHLDMWRQSKVLPLGSNELFVNNQGSRPLPPHTVARNPYGSDKNSDLKTDNPFYSGFENGILVKTIPAEAMERFDGDRLKMVQRGQERFNIYCSPCHGRLGDGNGMIAQRGFNTRRKPANYHDDKIVRLPDGHYFDVMTNGFGVMFSYAARVEPADRWAIVSYIRTLQLSQNARISDVPAGNIQDLDKPETSESEPKGSGAAGE